MRSAHLRHARTVYTRRADGAVRASIVLSCAVFLAAALSGCARLPDVGALIAYASHTDTTLQWVDGSGVLLMDQQHERLRRMLSMSSAPDMLARHLPVAAAISNAPLVIGNRLMLLQDGPAIEQAILDAIRAATDHVNIETYVLADDEVGRRFADVLLKKRAEGVAVALMYDSFASIGTSKSYYDGLRAAGVRVLEYHPIDPLHARRGWNPNGRDHRKIFIVDGRTAILGGANIEHPHEVDRETYWRDTDIRIDGPAVAQLQALFLQTWRTEGGEPLPSAKYFPIIQPFGREIVRILVGPDVPNAIYTTLVSAIIAAQRGVQVELMLPSVSDFAPALAAGRSHYQELLDSGVVIYERQHAWLHAKTAVIDGVWSTVGSTNLDRRSFLFNQEINAVIWGREFGDRMELAFAEDRAASRRILHDECRQRGVGARLGEYIAGVFSYWW